MELADLLPSATEEDMAVTVGAKIVHHQEEEEEEEFPMSNVVQVSPAVLRKQMPFMPQASAVISAVKTAVFNGRLVPYKLLKWLCMQSKNNTFFHFLIIFFSGMV